MAEVVTLSCSACGARLQIPATVQQFACQQCGKEYTIQRGGGIVFLEPVGAAPSSSPPPPPAVREGETTAPPTDAERAALERDIERLRNQPALARKIARSRTTGVLLYVLGAVGLAAGALLFTLHPTLAQGILGVSLLVVVLATIAFFDGVHTSRQQRQRIRELESRLARTQREGE